MFETLSERFNNVFRNLSGRGRISEENVREAMGEVRTALLEADVHLDVVRKFCDEVITDAVGQVVLDGWKMPELKDLEFICHSPDGKRIAALRPARPQA